MTSLQAAEARVVVGEKNLIKLELEAERSDVRGIDGESEMTLSCRHFVMSTSVYAQKKDVCICKTSEENTSSQ